MNIEIEFTKELPIEQIEQFEDRVVYNVALGTREETKGLRAYPYLSGELERTEIAEPIMGSNGEYSLLAGVDYAITVWKYGNNTKWTNPSTEPQWYATVLNKHKETIVSEAVAKALKEI